jgi:hypothetical protein
MRSRRSKSGIAMPMLPPAEAHGTLSLRAPCTEHFYKVKGMRVLEMKCVNERHATEFLQGERDEGA